MTKGSMWELAMPFVIPAENEFDVLEDFFNGGEMTEEVMGLLKILYTNTVRLAVRDDITTTYGNGDEHVCVSRSEAYLEPVA